MPAAEGVSVIPPMNNPKLFGMLVIGLLLGVAGTAAAIGGDVGGLLGANADAQATYGVDYSGATNAVDTAKATATAEAKAKIDDAGAAVDAAEGKVLATAQGAATNSMKASADVKTSVLEQLTGNLQLYVDWVHDLFVKPDVNGPSTDAAAHVAKDITTDVGPGYVGASALGKADIEKNLESTAHLDYNLPPPPQPKIGFLGELKASFEWIGHMG